MRQNFSINIWFKIYFILYINEYALCVCWFTAKIGKIEFECHK